MNRFDAVSRSRNLSGRLMQGLALLLGVILALSAFPGWGEEAGSVSNLFGSSLLEEENMVQSMARAGDALYIRTTDALYTFTPGDPGPVKVADMASTEEERFFTGQEGEPGYQLRILTIFGEGEQLYGLEPFQQTLYILEIRDGQAVASHPVKMDLSSYISGEGVYRYVNMMPLALIDGRLYIKTENYEDLPGDLASYDIHTGERTEHQVNHLQSLAAFKDGQLIALRQNPNQRYSDETGEEVPAEIVLFDPRTDSLTETTGSLPFSSSSGSYSPLWYDENQDMLYAYSETDVFRFQGPLFERETIGYLPMFGAFWIPEAGGLQPLPDGRLALGFARNVFIRPGTEEGLKGTTVIRFSGEMDDPSVLQKALMAADDLVLRQTENNYGYLDQQTLASLFLTQSVETDLMSINASGFDVDKLIEKGYLLDLSGSAIIREFMEDISPGLSSPLMKDGAIYGIPFTFMALTGNAYLKPFEELGLSVPESVEELVSLTETWVSGFGDEHPEYAMFLNEMDIRSAMRRMVMDKYVAAMLGRGELVFDTPVFRDLMNRVETINYGDYALEPDWEDPVYAAQAEEHWNKTALLENDMYVEPQFAVGMNNSGDRRYVPLAVPLKQGEATYQDVDITLLVALSGSPHKEQTIRLLEEIVVNMDILTKAAMTPGYTQAIPNPNYEKGLKAWQISLNRLSRQLENTQGAEKSNLEEEYNKAVVKQFEEAKESMRFLATQEDLAMVHDLVSKLYVNTGLANAQRRAFYENYSLLEQFYDSAITLDQFIQLMDDKMRLVRMEYN